MRVKIKVGEALRGEREREEAIDGTLRTKVQCFLNAGKGKERRIWSEHQTPRALGIILFLGGGKRRLEKA